MGARARDVPKPAQFRNEARGAAHVRRCGVSSRGAGGADRLGDVVEVRALLEVGHGPLRDHRLGHLVGREPESPMIFVPARRRASAGWPRARRGPASRGRAAPRRASRGPRRRPRPARRRLADDLDVALLLEHEAHQGPEGLDIVTQEDADGVLATHRGGRVRLRVPTDTCAHRIWTDGGRAIPSSGDRRAVSAAAPPRRIDHLGFRRCRRSSPVRRLASWARSRTTPRSRRSSSARGTPVRSSSATPPTSARWSTPSPAAAPRTAASAPSRGSPSPRRRCTR